MIQTPIDQHVMNKLRPAIMKLLTELQVKEISYGDKNVKFFYLNLEVTIQVKTKTRK